MSFFSRVKADVEGIVSNIHAELSKLEGIAVAKEQQSVKALSSAKMYQELAAASNAIAADARSVVAKIRSVL